MPAEDPPNVALVREALLGRSGPDAFSGGGDRVVTLTADGQAFVWTIRDRKVVHFRWYEQAAAALADAGLEAS